MGPGPGLSLIPSLGPCLGLCLCLCLGLGLALCLSLDQSLGPKFGLGLDLGLRPGFGLGLGLSNARRCGWHWEWPNSRIGSASGDSQVGAPRKADSVGLSSLSMVF